MRCGKYSQCEVCEFCILLYYARKSVLATFVVMLSRAKYKSIQNSQTSHDCIFHILRYFSTKLHNLTQFMMLFPAVLMNFPNSKVCRLIGKWSIAIIFRIILIFNKWISFWRVYVYCNRSRTVITSIFSTSILSQENEVPDVRRDLALLEPCVPHVRTI